MCVGSVRAQHWIGGLCARLVAVEQSKFLSTSGHANEPQLQARGHIEDFAGELDAMDRFWGDRSWHSAMFDRAPKPNLFGKEELDKTEKQRFGNRLLQAPEGTCRVWVCR
jgi:hypothetical protein